MEKILSELNNGKKKKRQNKSDQRNHLSLDVIKVFATVLLLLLRQHWSKLAGPLGYFGVMSTLSGASLVAQTVKNLPTMREIQVRPLGQEDPLETRMATHSNTLA